MSAPSLNSPAMGPSQPTAPSATTEGGEAVEPRADQRRIDLELMGEILALKVALFTYGAIVLAVMSVGSGSPLDALTAWNRWDTPHYLDLAQHGYQAPNTGPGEVHLFIVFYPLFPALIAAVSTLQVDPFISALLVSGVASLAIGPLLYRLVAIEEGHAVAWRAVWFCFLFPTAYFLHIGYTESLFLALVIGALLAARTNRWLLAGVIGALATATRVNGLVLVPALAVEAGLQWWSADERRLRPEWAAIALVPAGFLAYLAVNQAVAGDPLSFLEVQRDHWAKQPAWPWEGIMGTIDGLGWRQDAFMVSWMELAFIGLGGVVTLVSAVRFRPTWTVWMAGNWLLFVSTAFILSVPRYSLVLFPIFAWLAVLARRPAVGVAIGLASAIGLGFFAAQFVLGRWAF